MYICENNILDTNKWHCFPEWQDKWIPVVSFTKYIVYFIITWLSYTSVPQSGSEKWRIFLKLKVMNKIQK